MLQVCECTDNYLGFDCSRCTFNHYGPNCSQMEVLPRPQLVTYTDKDWKKLFNILHMLRRTDSGYKVILEDTYPGNTSLNMANITVHDLFVWIHHYAAGDGDPAGGNYYILARWTENSDKHFPD